MSGRLEITVPGDSNQGSPNKRLHWQARRKLVKEWRDRARIVYQNAGGIAFYGQVQITFVIRRGRRLDSDNARSSFVLKAVIDGFVDAGMAPDDNPDFVLCAEVKQQIAKEWRDFPEVLVVVEEVE